MDTSYFLLQGSVILKEERLQVLEVVGSFKKLVFSQHSREVMPVNSQPVTVSTKPARAQARQNPDTEEIQAGIKAHVWLGVGVGVGLLVFDSFSECENRFSIV